MEMLLEKTAFEHKNLNTRVMTYYNALQQQREANISIRDNQGILKFILELMKKEGCYERKIYDKMKKMQEAHPITGIIFCTILGAIFLNLCASILFEILIRNAM